MKLLSIVVPCYGSAAYMGHYIRALLHGGEEVEILIVDDDSQKDSTDGIADRCERRYPTICQAVYQASGGHDAAVMTGLGSASGVFFKVVDSDNQAGPESYNRIFNILRDFMVKNTQLDLLISNLVYEKEGAVHKRVTNYRKVLPAERLVG